MRFQPHHHQPEEHYHQYRGASSKYNKENAPGYYSSPPGNVKPEDKENNAGWRPSAPTTAAAAGGEPMGTGTLNEVKSRLAQMQKNKQELEEKLRNYEAKIRSHFNK